MPPERTMRADRHMSDVEALMWNLEKDPFLSSTFANVTILDQAPDVDRLRRRMLRALQLVPRLRQRVVPALGRLAPPEWRDDPDFDVSYHVRQLGLPAPGTERQLFDLATVLAQTPFDRTRPLWEFAVIEGLEGGRAALFQKMHHTITDGEGGVRMSEQFIDVSRDQPEPPPVEEPPAGAGAGGDAGSSGGLFATTLDTMAHNGRRQLGVARRAVDAAADLATHPARLPAAGADIVETVRSMIRQVAVTDSSRSTLWVHRSLHRRFEVLRVPLDDAKRAAKALGGSINDLFVAAAAGGAAAYHRAKGVEVDELRISMPVSTRTDRSAGGNAFTPARLLVPAGLEHPVERFDAIRARLDATKRERALGFANNLAGLVNLLPTSLLVRFARQQVETVDFATSNVRGAPFELFIAGARIEANYPMGPTGGTAFNLTLLSYGGSLDMGLNVDTGAIDDPELLRSCIERSFDDLLAAGTEG
jgi:WS/DGAT/MGAT family acyltransferase